MISKEEFSCLITLHLFFSACSTSSAYVRKPFRMYLVHHVRYCATADSAALSWDF
ncbi:hypothetical protein DM02DRAFT_415898 [Periconia macrospinosa]|uniref:Uncharacterized protein n=1 Tax=Periconia macrospinosa TaxID=97972 RepID=A0A2V1DPA2_9PLEO|nr:hypothetical protein DM02DRAFT_415898 [Periconia macrospinosa]